MIIDWNILCGRIRRTVCISYYCSRSTLIDSLIVVASSPRDDNTLRFSLSVLISRVFRSAYLVRLRYSIIKKKGNNSGTHNIARA